MSDWRPNRDGSWAALDVGMLRNRKTRGLTAAQALLYVAGILHCADELTDGEIARNVLPQLRLESRARPSDVAHLVDSGLWVETPGGWSVVGYLDWNPPKQWWEGRRKANARRQAEWRDRNRAAREQAERNALRTPVRTGVTTRDVRYNPPYPPVRDQSNGDTGDGDGAGTLAPLADSARSLLEHLRAGEQPLTDGP